MKRGENLRNINRIDPLMQKFGELWKQCPDYRFGQLIYVIADKMVELEFTGGDIFFPEDDKWEIAIDALIGKFT